MVLWVTVILIVVVTVLAMFGAASIRKQRLQRKVQFDVTNLGNLESRFQLRAEDLMGDLSFSFYQNGAQLPEIIKADPAGTPVQARDPYPAMKPGAPKPQGQGMQRALSFSGTLGSLLMSLGTLLPSSVGSPITRAGSQLYQGQVKANRVQQLSRDAKRLGSSGEASDVYDYHQGAQSTAPAAGTGVIGVTWAESPAVRPGESMRFELLIKARQAGSNQRRAYLIKSQSAENEQSPLLVENGVAQIRGGFWSHRFYPQILILVLAAAALWFVFWLSSIGLLY